MLPYELTAITRPPLVLTGDYLALFVSLRVAAGNEHHCHCVAWVYLESLLGEVALGHTFQQVHEVALYAQHHDLGLRVAHARVVLYCVWLASHVYESEEEEALVVYLVGFESFYCRADDSVLDLLHEHIVGE